MKRGVAPCAPIAVGVVADVELFARAVALDAAAPIARAHLILIDPAPDKVGIVLFVYLVEIDRRRGGDIRIVVAHEHAAQLVFEERIYAVGGAVVADVVAERVVARNEDVSAAYLQFIAVVFDLREVERSRKRGLAEGDEGSVFGRGEYLEGVCRARHLPERVAQKFRVFAQKFVVALEQYVKIALTVFGERERLGLGERGDERLFVKALRADVDDIRAFFAVRASRKDGQERA